MHSGWPLLARTRCRVGARQQPVVRNRHVIPMLARQYHAGRHRRPWSCGGIVTPRRNQALAPPHPHDSIAHSR
eukprot:4950596-Prymnesium_polylepis.1